MKRTLLLLSLLGMVKVTTAQTNVLNATGKVGIGNSSPTTLLNIGSGTGVLHTGSQTGILFKDGTGDRSLMEIHSPDGLNKFVIQSLSYGSYLSSLDRKALFLQDLGGAVSIGTDKPEPNTALTVKGNIAAREVKVIATAGADFVFDVDYDLLPLKKVEKYVLENRHLPEVPSAREMIDNGWNWEK